MIAAGASRRRRLSAVLRHASPPRVVAIAIVGAIASVAMLTLAARHFDHYAERARVNQRTLLAEILAQPLCTSWASGDAAATTTTLRASFAATTTE